MTDSATPPPVIAIDGPSGSGKGTVAAALAAELGFHLLDSGALYRALGLAALRAGVDLEVDRDDAALGSALEGLAEGLVIDDEDEALRSEAVGRAASRVGAVAAARDALLARQRACRRPPGLVADGRDMGSRVFPDARLKIFLSADASERARRRHKQLTAKGIDVTLSAVLQDLKERDARDRQRAAAPLKPAEHAVVIDSTRLSIDEVLQQITALARQRLPGL